MFSRMGQNERGLEKKKAGPGAGWRRGLRVDSLNLSLCSSVNALYQTYNSPLRIDDFAPIQIAVLQAMNQNLGGGNVGGDRDVVYVADAQQVHPFGSLGLALMGSRKKSSMSTSSQAMRATICSAPP